MTRWKQVNFSYFRASLNGCFLKFKWGLIHFFFLKSFMLFGIKILLEFYEKCKEGIQYKTLIRFKTLWTSKILKLCHGESKRRHEMPTIICPASPVPQTFQKSFLLCSIPSLQTSQELFISFCDESPALHDKDGWDSNKIGREKKRKISDESGGGGDNKEGRKMMMWSWLRLLEPQTAIWW